MPFAVSEIVLSQELSNIIDVYQDFKINTKRLIMLCIFAKMSLAISSKLSYILLLTILLFVTLRWSFTRSQCKIQTIIKAHSSNWPPLSSCFSELFINNPLVEAVLFNPADHYQLGHSKTNLQFCWSLSVRIFRIICKCQRFPVCYRAEHFNWERVK